MKKNTVITNYIPHPTPKRPNFYEWFNTYQDDLMYLYYSMNQILVDRHDEEAPHDFRKFAQFIFYCSSKHIQN
jgi:hypothetical protein